MRILFDQNISFRLVRKILHIFPEAKQVRELGLENSTDRNIWEYAKNNGFTIITFDADFLDMSVLYGHPPKVIWLRFGNTKTDFLAQMLEERANEILAFITNEEFKHISCLEIIG